MCAGPSGHPHHELPIGAAAATPSGTAGMQPAAGQHIRRADKHSSRAWCSRHEPPVPDAAPHRCCHSSSDGGSRCITPRRLVRGSSSSSACGHDERGGPLPAAAASGVVLPARALPGADRGLMLWMQHNIVCGRGRMHSTCGGARHQHWMWAAAAAWPADAALAVQVCAASSSTPASCMQRCQHPMVRAWCRALLRAWGVGLWTPAGSRAYRAAVFERCM